MAIVQNPITGNSSGRLGNVIFYTSYGKNVIRTKPLKVKQPNTTGQIKSRSAFSLVQKFIAKNILHFRETCQSLQNNNSTYIAVISYYLQNCLQYSEGLYNFDTTKMIFSAGNLQNIEAPTVCTIDENQNIQIVWNDNTGTNEAAADDLINFVIYNATTNEVHRFQVTRETATLEILQTTTNIQPTDIISLFYFASNASRSQFSNTSPAIISSAPAAPHALEITWDDIANAPARTLEAWNTFFDLPNNGTAFTSFEEVGNVSKLFGASNINILEELFFTNSHIIRFEDFANSVISIDRYSFGDCDNLDTFYLPSCLNLSERCFANCVKIITLNIPIVSNFGGSIYNNLCFLNISNQTIILTIPHAIETDGDIVALKANNTVTVIYSD